MSNSDQDSSGSQLVSKVASRAEDGSDRRDAVKRIIRLLPGSLQSYLVELYQASGEKPEKEAELFSALRSTLNTLAQEGALPRRTFLQIAGLVVTGGLAPFLCPEKAHAWQAWTGFWQNISTNSYVASSTGLDPYWDYVVLLMNFDGSNGSTVFADESNVGKTPTIKGSTYIDASSSPYSGGKGSAKFNGTTDSISYASSSDFAFGTGDFTVEAFIYITGFGSGISGTQSHVVGINLDGTSADWIVQISSSWLGFYRNGSGPTFTASYTWNQNQWYHIAVCRISGTLQFFVNGSNIGSASLAASIGSSTGPLTIGAESSGSHYCHSGSIADLRVYNGIAKYTAAFTKPTAPIGLGSANDPYWGYCVLACPFENTLKDMSGKLLSATGGVSLDSATKKYGTASTSLNGSSQYISASAHPGFDFGTGDLTIEMWVYPVSQSGHGPCFSNYTSFVNGSFWLGRQYSTGCLMAGFKTAGDMASSTVIPLNQWSHIAFVRCVNTGMLFLNGTLVKSFTLTEALSNSQGINLGYYGGGGSNYFGGYIDSLRITKGYARYTANFTPPTAAFPVGKDETVDPFWTYTVLAMGMDGANGSTIFTDSTGRHSSITANGAAAISTSQSKLGGASASFDGSNSYLSMTASGDYVFGTDDFTVEVWVYKAASSASGLSVMDSTGSGQFGFYITDSQVVSFASKVGTYAINAVVALNRWTHIALTRVSGTLYLYIDGIQRGSISCSYSFVSPGTFLMGVNANQALQFWNGYLDDFRITKGIARYAQNFTPPTRALATNPVSSYADYDPFWSSVVLLMHMDGTNSSTTFTDSSSSSKSVTSNGSAAISTSQYKFGAASGSFNGSGQFLSVASNADFDFSTGDFTIEAWIRMSSTASHFYITNNGDDINFTGAGEYTFLFNSALGLRLFSNTANVVSQGGTTGWSANIWYHVACVRANGLISLYRNGVLLASATSSVKIGTSTAVQGVGGNSFEPASSNGYMDDFRITKGVARYISAFAPQSLAFSNSAGIVTSGLVAHLDVGDATSTWTSSTSQTQTFSYTGSTQTFTVPAGVTTLFVKAWGGGGGGNGAAGGYAEATIPVTSGTSLTVYVGGGGTMIDTSGSGGGYSGVFQSTTPLLIAGGGGGGASSAYGGGGGGTTGGTGGVRSVGTNPGTGGTQSAGGSTGGSYLQGGNGGGPAGASGAWPGGGAAGFQGGSYTNGGGGGGYYGGGGGGTTAADAAGGGGSSYISASASGQTLAASGTTAGNSSDSDRGTAGDTAQAGKVIISCTTPAKFRNLVLSPADSSSQSAYDFLLGNGSSASTFPTFTGVQGGRSANDYLLFDGGDYITQSSAQTTFLKGLHKGATSFTIVALIRTPAAFANTVYGGRLFSTGSAQSLDFGWQKDTKKLFVTFYGSDSNFYKTTDTALTESTFYLVAISHDASAHTAFFYGNGSYLQVSSANTFSTSFSSPSSTNSDLANAVIGIGGSLSSNTNLENTSRLYTLSIYNRALSKAELDQNWSALRSRFGI